MAFRIQIRRDTSINWAVNNPVLLQAEMGYETDTNKAKFGNGVDPWNDLIYFPTSIAGPTGPAGEAGPTGSAGPTGAAGTTVAVGVYSIKLEFDGGNLVGSPFVQAKDPDGNTITSGSGGWNFVRNSINSITISHPVGRWFINFNRIAQNSSGDWVTANVSGSSTSNFAAIQNSAKTQFTINSLSTGSGISLTGSSFLYLTWQVPAYDFS
jgi:hypothetical protein